MNRPMTIDYDELRLLPTLDKHRIIQFLEEDLAASGHSLASLVSEEDLRRAEEAMAELDAHPERALTEEEMWGAERKQVRG